MVSHDRRFIDAVATRVVEVDFGGLESYPGNYTYFLSKKQGTDRVVPKPSAKRTGEREDRRARRKREAELRNRRYKVIAPLKERVQALEKQAIIEGIKLFKDGKLKVEGRKVRILK